ncbi:MAG: hypothetical protein IK080_06240 [Clostridia bacterium]|nr:hypothetical protein [Clostridia bacterium]
MEDARRKYTQIIDLPHPVSVRRAQMSRRKRAAQFSPFAALTGYEDLIAETGRATAPAPVLDEAALEELDRKLACLCRLLPARPTVTVTVFCPDGRKSGGAYRTSCGVLAAIDLRAQALLLEGQLPIALKTVTDLRF